MAPKVKGAVGVLSDALETACGWAFCAVALYALLFVNMTGNGTLWESLKGVVLDAAPMAPMNASVQTRVVPVRPLDADDKAVKDQNRMLLLPNEPQQEFSVPVLASQQPARADQITDALADSKAGTDWHKHLAGTLRTFTVYGNGDQQSVSPGSAASAKASSGPAPVRVAAAPAPTPATSVSAFHAGITAETRPGITDHVSQVDAGTADGVQNFR